MSRTGNTDPAPPILGQPEPFHPETEADVYLDTLRNIPPEPISALPKDTGDLVSSNPPEDLARILKELRDARQPIHGRIAKLELNSALPKYTGDLVSSNHPEDLARILKELRDARQPIHGRIAKLVSSDSLPEVREAYYDLINLVHPYLKKWDSRDLREEARKLLADVVKPHVRYSDSQHINELLDYFEDMCSPVKPKQGTYNMLLQTYVQQIDVAKAFETIERIRKIFGVPGVYTWTMLVTLFAHRGDPDSAKRVFSEMVSNGVQPSKHTYTSLMNAYIEAGSWDQAIAIFDHLDAYGDDHPLKPDLHACTTLIKAYVLMGAPVSKVIDIYRQMIARNIKPSGSTFALLLQSACDAGMIDLAEEIFAKMDQKAQSFPKTDDRNASPAFPDVYSFSIMIRGLLRSGMKQEAKEYYDEMVQRGIEPSSATWSILISAYAQASDENAGTIVQGLLDDYLEYYLTNGDATSGVEKRVRQRLFSVDKNIARGTALHSVYGPVITAYAKNGNSGNRPSQTSIEVLSISALHTDLPDVPYAESQNLAPAVSNQTAQALQKFREMLSQPQSKPSITIYTALLDAYRRANDSQGLRLVWDNLFDFAVAATQNGYAFGLNQQNSVGGTDRPRPVDPSRRNLLCLPLSVYIEALSSNHLHEEVARVWVQAQQHGFGFDAGNWNHLAVALVRAGDVTRAFWTVDKILLEPDAEPERTVEREDLQEVTDIPANTAAELQIATHDEELELDARSARAETPIRPPNRAHEHQEDVKKHYQRYGTNLSLPEAAEENVTEFPVISSPQVSPASPPEALGQHQSASTPAPVVQQEHRYDGHNSAKMTDSFSKVRRTRHSNNWTVHSATLRALEDAFARLEQVASLQNDAQDELGSEQQIVRRRSQAAEQVSAIRSEHGLVLQAIAQHRDRLEGKRSWLARAL